MKKIWMSIWCGVALWGGICSAGPTRTMAVIVDKTGNLTASERNDVERLVANGLSATEHFRHVDVATLNQMIQDKSWKHVLEGNEEKLKEIEKAHKVEVIVKVSADIEAVQAEIGGYYNATGKVSISCLRSDKAILFTEQVSEAQTGRNGIPGYFGATQVAARQAALQAAVASAFDKAGIKTVSYPAPARIDVKLASASSASGTAVLSAPKVTNPEGLITPLGHSLGKKEKITATAGHHGGELAAIAILSIDINLGAISTRRTIGDRGRPGGFSQRISSGRVDTAIIEVVDTRRHQGVKTLTLPRDVQGIRRPKSRTIAGVAFSPTGRFLAVASGHPQIWVYDVFSGALLAQIEPKKAPKSIAFSKDGSHLVVDERDAYSLTRK